MKINVVTFNCFYHPFLSHNSLRLKDALSQIIKLDPDIICLQEVLSPGQMKVVEEILSPNYNIFNTPDLIFNDGGLVFASKYPFESKVFKKFQHKGIILSPQITCRMIGNGYQKVEISINDKNLLFYNVHIIPQYVKSSEEAKEQHEGQLDELIEDIKNSPNLPKVVIGDFNMRSFGEFYFKFIEQTKLVDPLDETAITTASENTFSTKIFNVNYHSRVDYILFSRDITAVNTELILKDLVDIKGKKMHLSDHYGINSVLEV